MVFIRFSCIHVLMYGVVLKINMWTFPLNKSPLVDFMWLNHAEYIYLICGHLSPKKNHHLSTLRAVHDQDNVLLRNSYKCPINYEKSSVTVLCSFMCCGGLAVTHVYNSIYRITISLSDFYQYVFTTSRYTNNQHNHDNVSLL